MTDDAKKNGLETPREQVIYANVLIIGVWLGILILLVTFGLYVAGVTTPHVAIEDTPRYWGMGVDEYAHQTAWPSGWDWTGLLGRGDILTYVGFILLALLSILGYMVLLVTYVRERSSLFSLICILEILVLGLAASGVLVAGGH
jgi:hypothetical protein